jgi:mannose-6-phosphate isomerase-like protein (cupin superfamily)
MEAFSRHSQDYEEQSHNTLDVSKVSAADLSAFSEELAGGQIIRFEDFTNDLYLDAVIDKPWGHEYRVYADLLIDVWKLMLATGQSTSMHCHPRKDTVLMCLAGSLRINFLSRSILVEAGQYARIPKGVFHSTDNVGSQDAHLIEVENPRNKFDLIRKRDRYGRQGQQYESNNSALPIAPLLQDPTSPYSKIRKYSLEGSFRFDVLPGMLVNHGRLSPDFVVSLSIEAAINQRIAIFKGGDTRLSQAEPDARYLVISRV